MGDVMDLSVPMFCRRPNYLLRKVHLSAARHAMIAGTGGAVDEVSGSRNGIFGFSS